MWGLEIVLSGGWGLESTLQRKWINMLSFLIKKKFDYVCYNPFLGYSPNSFFSQPQKEKRKKKWNSVVLNDIVLLLPLHTQRQGKKMFCSPTTPISLSPPTHLHKPKRIDTTYAPHLTQKKKKADKPCRWLPSGRTDTPYPCAMTGQG